MQIHPGDQMSKKPKRDIATAALRQARQAERMAGDGKSIGGTGFTILRRQDSPISRLVNEGKIGGDELRAAEDITIAFQATAGALMFRPLNLERNDRSAAPTEPAGLLDAIARYRAWAKVWTDRAARQDPTMEIVIAAVIDERGFREIEVDLNLRNGRSALATAAGLRDYAARSGWVQGHASERWLVDHGSVFRLRKLRPTYTTRYLARKWDSEAAA